MPEAHRETDTTDDGHSSPSTTILIFVHLEPDPGLRADDTVAGWDELGQLAPNAWRPIRA